MAAALPLDSPLWNDLTACWSATRVIELLREVVASQHLGVAWSELRDELIHQGTVYQVSSAVLPHLVALVPHLADDERTELLIDIGMLVTAGADQVPLPEVPSQPAALEVALTEAGRLTVRHLLTTSAARPDDRAYLALTAVALAGHSVGEALWQLLSTGNAYCRLICPGCDEEYEVDGFTDPIAPPGPAPAYSPGRADAKEPWASAVRDGVFGAGWDAFTSVARQVAADGVPGDASDAAVWCLVAALTAASPAEAGSSAASGAGDDSSVAAAALAGSAAAWGRTLARLTGHFRCDACGTVAVVAEILANAPEGTPVDPASVDPSTLASGDLGFPPARRPPATVRALTERSRTTLGPVTALAAIPGAIAALTPAGTLHVVPQTGSSTGNSSTLAATELPDGGWVFASVSPSGLAWHDATGAPLGISPPAGGAAIRAVTSARTVERSAQMVPWLHGLPASTALIATGDAEGTVHLWDPATRTPLAEVHRRAGHPVTALASLNRGTDLVTVYSDHTADIWSSRAVHGDRSTMAPRPDRLAAAGHHAITMAAAAPVHRGYTRPVLLADADGTVSMWETFGVRLADPLPPDPAHREVVALAALAAGPDDIVVVTASAADRNLRLWSPAAGTVTLAPLDIRPRALLAAPGTLTVAHDDGLLFLHLP